MKHTRVVRLPRWATGLCGVIACLALGLSELANGEEPTSAAPALEAPPEALVVEKLRSGTPLAIIRVSGPPYQLRMKPEEGAVGLFLLIGPAALMDDSGRTQPGEDQIKLGLVDPLEVVARRFQSIAGSATPPLQVRIAAALLDTDEVAAVSAQIAEEFAITLKTRYWRAQHVPKEGLGSYRIDYAADAKLIRIADGAVAWRAGCAKSSSEAKNMHKMRANSGLLLKQGFTAVAEACADDLWTDFGTLLQRQEGRD